MYKYRATFLVHDSVSKTEEILESKNIINKEMTKEMIKFMEKEEDLVINENKDILRVLLNKRTHRYIYFFNCQFTEDKDDIKIYESEAT